MLIDVIDDFASFERLRPDWDDVYDADPDAQVFLSWTWLSQWLPMLSGSWFILAAKPDPDAKYVAFFPLRWNLKESKTGFHNEINMAGNYAADYTGFICRPEFDESAISAFARHFKRLNWRRVNLDYIRTTEARLRLFLSNFSDKRFETKSGNRIDKRDNINNLLCPQISLPDQWDSYLATRTSTNMRQKLRRFLRQIERDHSFRITHSQGDEIERDLKIVLKFWTAKWGHRKGDRLSVILKSNYNMLRRCGEAGQLFLPMLWRGDQPLGGLASLIDPRKKAIHFYLAGRDESFNDPPPGLVLHAHSIRHAISLGFVTYDFLRGNEAYKYSFGAKERPIACITVGTRSERNFGDKLEPGCLPSVFKRSVELHKAGKIAHAERGYRQILDTDPNHAQALFCLGQLMVSRGKHGAAKRIFTTLTELRPQSEKAWMWLAQSLEARQRVPDAIRAYQRLVDLNRTSPGICNKLGKLLFEQHRYEEAVAAFEEAIRRSPENEEADINRANTLFVLGRLLPEEIAHYAEKNAGLGDKIGADGSAQRAMHCYRQALAMKGDLARAHYGLARMQQVQGETKSAERSYRRAADIDPEYRAEAARLPAIAPTLTPTQPAVDARS
jgi:tetratricopeptide (TPR) repeat protein/CelD/BcsL family acetyltransferase involved in cellulose biosynthesis